MLRLWETAEYSADFKIQLKNPNFCFSKKDFLALKVMKNSLVCVNSFGKIPEPNMTELQRLRTRWDGGYKFPSSFS